MRVAQGVLWLSDAWGGLFGLKKTCECLEVDPSEASGSEEDDSGEARGSEDSASEASVEGVVGATLSTSEASAEGDPSGSRVEGVAVEAVSTS